MCGECYSKRGFSRVRDHRRSSRQHQLASHPMAVAHCHTVRGAVLLFTDSATSWDHERAMWEPSGDLVTSLQSPARAQGLRPHSGC